MSNLIGDGVGDSHLLPDSAHSSGLPAVGSDKTQGARGVEGRMDLSATREVDHAPVNQPHTATSTSSLGLPPDNDSTKTSKHEVIEISFQRLDNGDIDVAAYDRKKPEQVLASCKLRLLLEEQLTRRHDMQAFDMLAQSLSANGALDAAVFTISSIRQQASKSNNVHYQASNISNISLSASKINNVYYQGFNIASACKTGPTKFDCSSETRYGGLS
ncbi:hypothetical protein LTR28_011479 [Elasticomyces elasticus]|nr:hypothetical protein LTR28_011479 [Elasticomyces elasticus]